MAERPHSDTRAWHQNRSRLIMRWATYFWLIFPIVTSFFYLAYSQFIYGNLRSWLHIRVDNVVALNVHPIRWLILIGPTRPMSFMGIFFMLWPSRPLWLRNQPIKRSFTRLLICLVTKGDNVEIVKQSVRAAQGCYSSIDPRISFHVLTEETKVSRFNDLPRSVKVHGTQTEFQPSKAKYKARSLEWFRVNLEIKDDDWVLHIDEETAIDEYLVRTCIDFITRQGDKDVGTGVIHYNLPGYYNNALTAVGDMLRLQDDWFRVPGLANYRNYIALGVHGGFLLVRGIVENAVTWDTDSLTEDYWFLLGAKDKGYRFGWVPAIAREMSPESIKDFIRQRRRWYTGMSRLGRLSGTLEALSCAWNLFWPLYILLDYADKTPRPMWFFYFLCLDAAVPQAIMMMTLLIQDIDAGLPLRGMVYTQLVSLILAPMSVLVSGWAAFWGLFWPDKDWYVIRKRPGNETKED
ncbi:glycosyltransferase like family 2-domain-containing protein [Hypoxylon argillaceum]|nr:glycosyltransferase like family 2-domain-containing protein [Hypoxylon argillaceum]